MASLAARLPTGAVAILRLVAALASLFLVAFAYPVAGWVSGASPSTDRDGTPSWADSGAGEGWVEANEYLVAFAYVPLIAGGLMWFATRPLGAWVSFLLGVLISVAAACSHSASARFGAGSPMGC
jgi:hypothetical protein